MSVSDCKSSKSSSTSTTNQQTSSLGEVVIHVRGKVKTTMLEGAYQRYQLKVKEAIDAKKNIWLFTYDPQSISLADLQKMLEDSQFALKAEAQ